MKNIYYNKKVELSPLKDGKRETILQWIYDSHLVEWYTTYLLKKPINYGDIQDIIQDIYIMICELPQDKLDGLYKQGAPAISAYITGLIHRQVVSSNSAIYRKYNKYNNTELVADELFWEQFYENN